MIDRERKVDLSKMSEAELQALEAQLGGKVRQICDEACEKANRLLNIYGLSCKMQIVIDDGSLKKEPIAPLEAPKKKGRTRKALQSLQ